MKPNSVPAAIVVLGTAQYDGRPAPVFRARLDTARELFTAHATIYTLGYKLPGDRFTEAAAGRNYLIDHGVPAEKVVAVEEGLDTVTSLQAALINHPALKHLPAVIVTDSTHRLRSYLIARRLGFAEVTTVGAHHSPLRFPRPNWFHAVAHEAGGLIVELLARRSPRAARAASRYLHRIEDHIRPSRAARNKLIG